MIPCILFDLPTIGAFALASILVATVYLIYRDIRMIMQMVVDLREEFMALQIGKHPAAHADDGEDEEEEEDSDEDFEEECDEGDHDRMDPDEGGDGVGADQEESAVEDQIGSSEPGAASFPSRQPVITFEDE